MFLYFIYFFFNIFTKNQWYGGYLGFYGGGNDGLGVVYTVARVAGIG